MPNYEIRIIDYDLLLSDAFLDQLNMLPIETVSIGSESCPNQLPPADSLRNILRNLSGYRIKFNVPILMESYFDRVISLLEPVPDRVDALSVNDLGTLNYLHRTMGAAVADITFGNVPGIIISSKTKPLRSVSACCSIISITTG